MALGFSRGVTHFYRVTLTYSIFSKFPGQTLKLQWSIYKSISWTTLLVFFLETDLQIDVLCWVLRYPAHCTDIELLPEPPQNKIYYRLHRKYTSFSCSPIICSSAIWKSLFLRNRSYLRHSLRKLTEYCSKLLAITFATCRLFSTTFYESITIDVSKKLYVVLCNFWICRKNIASSCSHYL